MSSKTKVDNRANNKINNKVNNKANNKVSSRTKGQIAEDKAADYLQKNKLLIVNRNFYSRFGEIDIILLQHAKNLFKETILIFCEVRSRKNLGYGSAIESISVIKQKKLRKTAHYFMLKNPQYANLAARFDVLIVPTASQQSKEIQGTEKDNDANIHWLKNAF